MGNIEPVQTVTDPGSGGTRTEAHEGRRGSREQDSPHPPRRVCTEVAGPSYPRVGGPTDGNQQSTQGRVRTQDWGCVYCRCRCVRGRYPRGSDFGTTQSVFLLVVRTSVEPCTRREEVTGTPPGDPSVETGIGRHTYDGNLGIECVCSRQGVYSVKYTVSGCVFGVPEEGTRGKVVRRHSDMG